MRNDRKGLSRMRQDKAGFGKMREDARMRTRTRSRASVYTKDLASLARDYTLTRRLVRQLSVDLAACTEDVASVMKQDQGTYAQYIR